MSPLDALTEIVDRCGSQSAVARALEVSQSAVWKWLNETGQLPAEHVLEAERRWGTSRHYLRPDIYPREYLIDRPVSGRFYAVEQTAVAR